MAFTREDAWTLLTEFNQDKFHLRHAVVALHRNLDKNDKANKVYISKRGTTLWQKKTDRKQRSAAA